MNDSQFPSVTITFDGMMLFYFDHANQRCEVMFGKVHDHEMKITVKKRNGNDGSIETRAPLRHDDLSYHDALWLYVAEPGKERNYRASGQAKQGGQYKRILRLDGSNFYGELAPLQIKRGKYKPTMYVCDGDVGVGEGERLGLTEADVAGQSTCYRVTKKEQAATPSSPKYSFEELAYGMPSAKWELLKTKFPALIVPLAPFLRWVNTAIPLTQGQDLMLMPESQDGTTEPFPLITNYQRGDEYWIHVAHLDSDRPKSLEDCKGMGHHCESFELQDRDLFSVFSPNAEVVQPTPPWERIARSSDVPCCLSACVDQYTREQED